MDKLDFKMNVLKECRFGPVLSNTLNKIMDFKPIIKPKKRKNLFTLFK